MIGNKLAHYEITGHLGSGGMGDVYQATDSKLGRSVAIKFLPEAFSHDNDRVARFEREARALASLNHSNIAAIHGLEESGERKFLVMELVEGETLALRIKRGPIPIDESLEIAKQICEALGAAHEKGIIHRDLKPANIKITPDGKVKVLDFGLAKAFEAESANPVLTSSPTLSMAATNAGLILGTAAYMSPEQAKGRAVDRRTDIFAFGCVLYEMLTGCAAFEGEDVSDILSAVLKSEPDWTRLPSNVPSTIQKLLRLCLQKDVKKRRQTTADVGIDIEDALAEPAVAGIPAAEALASISRSRARVWKVAVAGLLTAVTALAFVHFRETPPVLESLRFQIPPPGSSAAEYLALSPDGRFLAFVASNGGPSQVWVRAMDTLESRALAGTDGAIYPFWSPDGAYLGFFTQGKLKKIAIAGGPAQTLCDAASGRGGSWNRDGVIIFSAGPTSPLFRVPGAGGVPAPVTKLPEGDSAAGHRFPVFLPDGGHFLYNVGSDKADDAGVFIGSLDGTVRLRILPDVTNALYAAPSTPGASGHLLFRRENTLMAQPFDSSHRRLTGDVFPLVEEVPVSVNTGFGAFSISENGTLVFRSGAANSNRELVWIDRAGKRLGAVGKPGAFAELEISPDEKKVVFRMTGAAQTLWMLDIGREVLSRFTFRPGISRNPKWSPDGNHVAFAFQTPGSYAFDIFRKPAGGNGQEELLLHAGVNGFPNDWSPDGKWIVYQQTTDQKTAANLLLLPLDGDRKPTLYLQTAFDEVNARFSPDGKWMAYQSNESGENQIYMQSVPLSGAKFLISLSGGIAPRWRHDGKELFYVSADQKLMAVPMKLGTTLEAGTPQPLFPVLLSSPSQVAVYSPSRDGQRFLVIVPSGGSAAVPVTVVTHWQTALKK